MQESKKEKSGGYDFRSKGTADQTLMIETMQFITYYNVKRRSLWGRGSRRGPQRRGQRCHTELAFKVLYSSASAASGFPGGARKPGSRAGRESVAVSVNTDVTCSHRVFRNMFLKACFNKVI